eukprot:CAMPEP_0201687378 /NCGR_PEP_ID=MMETSP0578-20130828/1471_1 /ASSEMBLY_ACC=CAM_ASM_000663 /TAXON_ID=267565 /ORGANISM="Skeletonema grethea, Strain CCMP 1804" /LENGTH=191 /DNA_ID=CAMNT_0048171529 /DNA_START=389 /DNA_END=960 /DNA_ORIENTATION=-
MNGYDQNSIGTTLDGSGVWKRIHGGTIEDTRLDNDGATFLGSFGPLQIEAGDTKSIYLRFTKSVLRVTNLGVDADGWDANATSLNGNDMQIGIGREAIFWITTNPDQFNQFYTPSIIPCNVWAQEACAPTASPTTTSRQPTVTPTISVSPTLASSMSSMPMTQPLSASFSRSSAAAISPSWALDFIMELCR